MQTIRRSALHLEGSFSVRMPQVLVRHGAPEVEALHHLPKHLPGLSVLGPPAPLHLLDNAVGFPQRLQHKLDKHRLGGASGRGGRDFPGDAPCLGLEVVFPPQGALEGRGLGAELGCNHCGELGTGGRGH